MDIITALKEYWQLVAAACAGLIWLTLLQFRQLRDNADRVRDSNDMREQIAGVRKDLDELETKAEHDRFAQSQFQLSVTDRLARIETTISTGIRDIQSAIRDVLKP